MKSFVPNNCVQVKCRHYNCHSEEHCAAPELQDQMDAGCPFAPKAPEAYSPSPDSRPDPAMPVINSPGAPRDYPGFSKLERACLDLRLPESNTPWLDALIAKAQLRDITGRIAANMAGAIARFRTEEGMEHIIVNRPMDISEIAQTYAAALIERVNK